MVLSMTVFTLKEHYTSQRAKHIDVRLHWIRQSIAAGIASLSHIPTRDNPADLFNKNLPRDSLVVTALLIFSPFFYYLGFFRLVLPALSEWGCWYSMYPILSSTVSLCLHSLHSLQLSSVQFIRL